VDEGRLDPFLGVQYVLHSSAEVACARIVDYAASGGADQVFEMFESPGSAIFVFTRYALDPLEQMLFRRRPFIWGRFVEKQRTLGPDGLTGAPHCGLIGQKVSLVELLDQSYEVGKWGGGFLAELEFRQSGFGGDRIPLEYLFQGGLGDLGADGRTFQLAGGLYLSDVES